MSKPTLVKTPAKFPKNSTFDPPEKYTIKDPPGVPGRCAEFFAYWKRLAGTAQDPQDRSDLVEARFYMHRPKISMALVDPKRKNNVYTIVTGPLWFENPEDYMEEVPKRFGSASWHVVLNEVGVHGALADCYFEAGSYEEYPPQVDLRTLVRDAAENEDYLRFLRIKETPLPWEQSQEEDFDDMAGEGVRVAFEAVTQIAEKAMESKDRETEAKIKLLEAEAEAAANEDDEDPEEEEGRTLRSAATMEAMGVMSHAMKEVTSMVSRNAGSQFNPMEMMKTAHEFAKDAYAARGTDPAVGMLVEAIKDQGDKMVRMQEQNLEFSRSVIGMQKAADGTWLPGQQQPQGLAGLVEQVKMIREVGGVLGFRVAGSAPELSQAPPEPPKRGIMDAIAENPAPWLMGITTVMTLAANIAYNVFSKDKVSPQEALQRAGAMQAQQQPQQAHQPQQQQQQQYAPNDIRAWGALPQHIGEAFRSHYWARTQD